MPVKSSVVGLLMLILSAAQAAKSPPPPDMDILEFLGNVETDDTSGQQLLTAIDTQLLPEPPEKAVHE